MDSRTLLGEKKEIEFMVELPIGRMDVCASLSVARQDFENVAIETVQVYNSSRIEYSSYHSVQGINFASFTYFNIRLPTEPVKLTFLFSIRLLGLTANKNHSVDVDLLFGYSSPQIPRMIENSRLVQLYITEPKILCHVWDISTAIGQINMTVVYSHGTFPLVDVSSAPGHLVYTTITPLLDCKLLTTPAPSAINATVFENVIKVDKIPLGTIISLDVSCMSSKKIGIAERSEVSLKTRYRSYHSNGKRYSLKTATYATFQSNDPSVVASSDKSSLTLDEVFHISIDIILPVGYLSHLSIIRHPPGEFKMTFLACKHRGSILAEDVRGSSVSLYNLIQETTGLFTTCRWKGRVLSNLDVSSISRANFILIYRDKELTASVEVKINVPKVEVKVEVEGGSEEEVGVVYVLSHDVRSSAVVYDVTVDLNTYGCAYNGKEDK